MSPMEILDRIDTKLLDQQIKTLTRLVDDKRLTKKQRAHIEGLSELCCLLHAALTKE